MVVLQQPRQSKDGSAVRHPECHFHERRSRQRKWARAVCCPFRVNISYILHITLSIHRFNHVWTVCGCVLCCRRYLEYSEETPSWPRVRQLWHDLTYSWVWLLWFFLFILFIRTVQKETWRLWWREEGGDRRVCATEVRLMFVPPSTVWSWEHWWWLLAAGYSSFI